MSPLEVVQRNECDADASCGCDAENNWSDWSSAHPYAGGIAVWNCVISSLRMIASSDRCRKADCKVFESSSAIFP